MYTRNERNPMRQYVEEALSLYAADIYNVGAGYSIIRYAQRGLIRVADSVDSQLFVDWYPRDQSYILLRLAQQGKLFYYNVEE